MSRGIAVLHGCIRGRHDAYTGRPRAAGVEMGEKTQSDRRPSLMIRRLVSIHSLGAFRLVLRSSHEGLRRSTRQSRCSRCWVFKSSSTRLVLTWNFSFHKNIDYGAASSGGDDAVLTLGRS